MDLIVFLPPVPDPADDARRAAAIGQQWRAGQVEVLTTLEDLARKLGRPRPEEFFLLLWPASGAYLDRLVAMRELMSTLPLVCVLPDSLPESLVKGHLLRPRLLLEPDEAEAIIAQVLRNFQNRVKPSYNIS